MSSLLARATRSLRQTPRLLLSSRCQVGAASAAVTNTLDRGSCYFFSSTTTPADPEIFKPEPPNKIDRDMAEGIQDSTLFYLRNGVANQRLLALAMDEESPLTVKWPRMMEIYLSTQVFVISGLGFSGDERGLQLYTQKLAEYMQTTDDETKDMYKKVGQETWRELLCTTFDMNPENVKSINIVDARNIMHKVCSKMQEPAILMKIQKECGKVPDGMDIEAEVAQKHAVLQSVVLNDVYLGGSPSIPEEHGFEGGNKGYAHLQCVMADYEGDPLISQYMAAATTRMWEAAGLDVEKMQSAGGGNIRLPQAG